MIGPCLTNCTPAHCTSSHTLLKTGNLMQWVLSAAHSGVTVSAPYFQIVFTIREIGRAVHHWDVLQSSLDASQQERIHFAIFR